MFLKYIQCIFKPGSNRHIYSMCCINLYRCSDMLCVYKSKLIIFSGKTVTNFNNINYNVKIIQTNVTKVIIEIIRFYC